jgi:hypothetical protein
LEKGGGAQGKERKHLKVEVWIHSKGDDLMYPIIQIKQAILDLFDLRIKRVSIKTGAF